MNNQEMQQLRNDGLDDVADYIESQQAKIAELEKELKEYKSGLDVTKQEKDDER